MKLIVRLVHLRRFRIAREILALYCVEIPPEVEIGKDFELIHRGFGTVIHKRTRIGDRVRITHGVTIGRADVYTRGVGSPMDHIEIGDDAVLCPGCVVLGGPGVTRVGNGTVIAANAVLTQSTGEYEIWGGVPARKLSDRPRS
jgi:serine O-acetyltransferase